MLWRSRADTPARKMNIDSYYNQQTVRCPRCRLETVLQGPEVAPDAGDCYSYGAPAERLETVHRFPCIECPGCGTHFRPSPVRTPLKTVR